jgi:hypothetical protein
MLSRRAFVRTIGFAGAAGVVAQPLGDAPALAPSEQKAIEEIAREFMERFKVPGLSVAFAREGKVVLSRGLGVAGPARAKLDDEGKEKLKLAQRAWVQFRDAQADFDADKEARGGSMPPLIYNGTRKTLTDARIKELQRVLKEQQ